MSAHSADKMVPWTLSHYVHTNCYRPQLQKFKSDQTSSNTVQLGFPHIF